MLGNPGNMPLEQFFQLPAGVQENIYGGYGGQQGPMMPEQPEMDYPNMVPSSIQRMLYEQAVESAADPNDRMAPSTPEAINRVYQQLLRDYLGTHQELISGRFGHDERVPSDRANGRPHRPGNPPDGFDSWDDYDVYTEEFNRVMNSGW